MSSHDSFAASGNSPTRPDGPDFRCENHGSLFLLFPSLNTHTPGSKNASPKMPNGSATPWSSSIGISGPSSMVFRTPDWR
jgi:hypothetical protein